MRFCNAMLIYVSVSKVFIRCDLEEFVTNNISEKEDSSGFKSFDLSGEFLPFVTNGCQSSTKY